MIWTSWRQQRLETLIGAGLLVLLGLVIVPTGLHMAAVYRHDDLSACLTSSNGACGDAIQAFTQRFESLNNLIAWVTVVPGLIGVMLAAPFVLDLENGTYRVAWTQSITRRRWLATTFGTAIGTAIIAAVVLTALMTWWRTPIVHLQGRMENSAFDSEGTVVIGYTLFALDLAFAVGALWRKAVAALAVAFVGYMVARIFVDTWLRQRLVPPIESTWLMNGNGPKLDRAWVISQYPSDRLGHRAALSFDCVRFPKQLDRACLLNHGAGYMHAVYEPASRFWLMQGAETALFGCAALALAALAAWWTHRRG